MIRLLTEKIGPALALSIVVLVGYVFVLADYSWVHIAMLLMLLAEGLVLDYLCYRFGIVGRSTHLPLVLFTLLAALLVPDLGVGTLVYGAIFLSGFYFAFESIKQPKQASSFVIYIGILLAIAQVLDSNSILLLASVLLLFIQAGNRKLRHYLLGLFYFLMVLFSYSSLLFVMELDHKIWELVPSLSFDYSVLNRVIMKLVIPFLTVSLIVHILLLGTYKFRYPNTTKIINFTFLTQLIVSFILVLLAAQPDILAYGLMPAAILLSFAFSYKDKSVFANAAFASLVVICMMSLYLHQIIML